MIPLLIALCWLCVVMALLITMYQRFRAFEILRPGTKLAQADAPVLTAIVPARNEATNIQRCLAGLLAQSYPAQCLEVLVVDDNSTDETASIVHHLAKSDSRLRLIEAGPLPDGWMGKPHACWQGVKAAKGEWFCFIDADTTSEPALLEAAVTIAQARDIDLLTLQPFQEVGTFWERLIIPSGLLLIGLAVDIRRVNEPAASDAVACGQFILIRRQVYDAVQGHATVRAEILEDVALAHEVKRAGYRLYGMSGGDLVRTRMYTSLRGLWNGLSKNAIDLAGNIPRALLSCVIAFLLAWLPVVLPWWTWNRFAANPGQGSYALAFGIALLGSVALFVAHVMATMFFRIPFWYGLLFPLGLTMEIAIVLNSIWQRTAGRVVWKGREYSFEEPNSAG